MSNWYQFYVTDGAGNKYKAPGMSLTSGSAAMEKAEQLAKKGVWVDECKTFIVPSFIRKVQWEVEN